MIKGLSKLLKHETIRSHVGWECFAGRISPERCDRIRLNAARREFRRNPHHRCDYCGKPMSAVSGNACEPCLDKRLKFTTA